MILEQEGYEIMNYTVVVCIYYYSKENGDSVTSNFLIN
jgi:hypothetical protein